MATKFIRGLVFNSGSTTARASYMLKFMYEFWGYCVYGGASLSSPGTGAFAATTPFGGSLPTNFTEGTSVLTSGSDGVTVATTIFRQDGYTDFTAASAPFTSNMVGKQLVMWKAGSNSSEDSIYNIIAFKSSSNIVINVNNGGMPSAVDGYKPSMTNRSSINYRVVDVASAGVASGIADGNYMVFQFDPTGVNTGQANPQLQFLLAGSNLRFDYKISPNGSWTGSAFGADGSGTLNPNSVSSTSFFNGSTSGQAVSITLIGDKDFLIGHSRDSNNSHGSGYCFHIEIPERLYTQAQDINPFAVNINGFNSAAGQQVFTTTTNSSYGGGFIMKCNDGTFRNHRTTVRALAGDGNATLNYNIAQTPGNSLSDFRPAALPQTGQILSSSGFLTLPGVAGQYSLARCRLRKVIFSNIFMPQFTRFGASNSDYILITQGVAFPWDKTVIPLTLFPF